MTTDIMQRIIDIEREIATLPSGSVSKKTIKDKVYDISIFTIEDNELIGAVISDVTKSEIDRSKIAKKAREVITKNIARSGEVHFSERSIRS